MYDFDGLLIDSETAGFISWQETYEFFGHRLDEEYWLAETLAGRGPCMPKQQLADLLAEPVDWDDVEERRLKRRNELLILRPGVLAHLDHCAEIGGVAGIVSNAPEWWVEERMNAVGLDRRRFDVIISKSPMIARKPAPESYLAALDALDMSPRNAIAFEDSPIGVQAARAADIRCVAVPNLVTEKFDLSAADLILPTIDAWPVEQILEHLAVDR